jgi:hypothetical protein
MIMVEDLEQNYTIKIGLKKSNIVKSIHLR